MNITKRNGQTVEFDKSKVKRAILKAFIDVDNEETSYAKDKAREIANYIESLDRDMTVEEVQDVIVNKLMASSRKDIATKYVEYRYKRHLIRESNTTDKSILELLNGTNEYWNNENSNKNEKVVTVQRDYLAGITSTDITKRFLLPEDIVKADEDGIIHFHDADYFAQNALNNCCLINLEDMLQNGTVINEVMIEKPHRFITASTIATQVITAVTSSQYGGATITLTHLAPFIRDSFNRYMKKYRNWGFNEDNCNKYSSMDLKNEIKDGVQTFNYQINSMMTTNGQAPFLSICMYLGETDEYKEELAMLIEEFLRQRIEGMKNTNGIPITQAFPKILYVLEEDNIHEESKYWYLTTLAAECTAKRMVPDYISEKKMLELKGDCFPCMGCVEGNEIITYKFNNKLYVESFKRMWSRMSDYYNVNTQDNGKDLYINVDNVLIYDTEKGFVKVNRVIRNRSNNFMNVKMSHGRSLLCTSDHPFHTKRGRIFAKDLVQGDKVNINPHQYFEESLVYNDDKAWLLGFILCDGCYDSHVSTSIAFDSENDIQDAYIRRMKECFNSDINVVERHRGERGTYKDLCSIGNVSEIIDYLSTKFEGLTKLRRHIPNEVFSWNYSAKLNFLAGMIDADGYINPTTHNGSVVQIGSTNKELALQQMALAQSLDMPCAIYQNHYSKKNPNAIRYRVEFAPTEELLSFIVSQKKIDNCVENGTNYQFYESEVNSVEPIMDYEDYSYDVTTESDHFEVSGIYSHNCRSFLTPDRTDGNISNANNYNGAHKYYGRFNQGVVTINLVDIALSSHKNVDEFWKLFEERTELCHRALQCRHERLEGTLSDVAPILWQDGAFARLKKHEPIDELLHHGYSTLSLGYAGLYECVKYMTGDSHTDNGIGKEFGLNVMQALNDKCTEWKMAEDIDYSLYGSPIESTTYAFAKALKKRFGIIEGITDRNYITNSYHVPVFEPIDAFAKLSLESEFQELSPGGAISYVEVPNMVNNIPAVLSVIKFIYENIMYAELNTKSDYCHVCGYTGQIQIITDDDGKLIWECPQCKNRDQDKMNVARRTCGYIGTQFWNQGRTQEIKERVLHL